jgi:serine protease Do
LKSGDVVLAVDGQTVAHSEDLPRMVAGHHPGTQVRLTVLHDKQTHDVGVTLAALEEGTEHARGSTPDPAAPAGPSSAIGVGVGDQDGQVVVERVAPDSPADGKLRPGDVIEEVNHQPVTSVSDLSTKIRSAASDRPLLLRVRHGESSRYVAIARSVG